MGSIRNTECELKEHQQQHVRILDNLPDLLPLEVVVLHTSLVTSDSVDGINALLFGEKSCVVGGVGQEDGQNDGPDKGNETEDDKEPLNKKYQ
jgi:hypothetical protein